jgi:hypothetical protein
VLSSEIHLLPPPSSPLKHSQLLLLPGVVPHSPAATAGGNDLFNTTKHFISTRGIRVLEYIYTTTSDQGDLRQAGKLEKVQVSKTRLERQDRNLDSGYSDIAIGDIGEDQRDQPITTTYTLDVRIRALLLTYSLDAYTQPQPRAPPQTRAQPYYHILYHTGQP